jgi:membrane-anchored glycerophosphoryl diester phosphodiesterase (GDPDase)
MKKKFFERKGVTWVFSAIALVSGVVFLDSNATGNVIVNRQNPVSVISLLGLLLILCSVILITYSAKKK